MILLLFGSGFVGTSQVATTDELIRTHSLQSRIFGNERLLRVLLPAGYNDKANRRRKYPVLYLNDGQSLFDASTSIFNQAEWQVDETVSRLLRNNNIEPLIVVGIDNAGRRERANEYLPYPDRFLSPPLEKPEGSKYPEFIKREVMPLIDRNYRTKSGRDHTAIGGSSYGALIALYSYVKLPDTFGRLLLESPSLYVSDGQIFAEMERQRKLPAAVYLGVGTNEDGSEDCKDGDIDNEAVNDVLKLKNLLLKKGLPSRKIKVLVEDCAVHHENAWAKRFPEALTFLFPVSARK